MTVKLSISVPDDVAAYLQAQPDASAAVQPDVALIESSNDISLRDSQW